MNIIEERIVGPSLGKENVDRGILSTWTGLLALAIFIIFYYSIYGIVSVISLVCNLGLLIALLSVYGNFDFARFCGNSFNTRYGNRCKCFD